MVNKHHHHHHHQKQQSRAPPPKSTHTCAGKQARTKAAKLSNNVSRSFGFVVRGLFSHVPSITECIVDQGAGDRDIAEATLEYRSSSSAAAGGLVEAPLSNRRSPPGFQAPPSLVPSSNFPRATPPRALVFS